MEINQQVLNLANNVLSYPLDDCADSDFLDKQEEYTSSYVALVDRFLKSAKRIQNDELHSEICSIETNIRHIWEAKKLQTEVLSVIDHINELVKKPDSNLSSPDIPMSSSHFNNHKSQLLEIISTAKFTIWVAVAWLTDNDLVNALIKKAEQGLNIRVVMNNDKINGKYHNLLKNKVDLLTVDPTKKLMHHKFCVIDLKLVAHGSFNWTVKANYNNETLEITYSTDKAQEFSEEFIKLVKRI